MKAVGQTCPRTRFSRMATSGATQARALFALRSTGGDRARRCLAAALLWAGLNAVDATESLPVIPLTQFGIESWLPDDGLAGSWVRDVAEMPDGAIWIATGSGLSRFDGRRFSNFRAHTEPGLPTNAVHALAVDARGRLWIGMDRGGVSTIEDGRLQRGPRLREMEGSPIVTLAATPDGSVWIGSRMAGLFRATGTAVVPVELGVPGKGVSVVRLHVAPDGALWIRTRAHGLWRIAGGATVAVADSPGCDGLDVAVGPDGTVYTACVNGIWVLRTGERDWRQLSPEPRTQRIALDRTGRLWAGSESGLQRIAGSHIERLRPTDGVGDYRVRALFEDRRGDLWAGTFSSGLSRLRRGAVLSYGAPEGLPIDATTAVLGSADGTLWIAASAHGVIQWQPGRGIIRWLKLEGGLPSDRVWALAEDPRKPGRLWLGTEIGVFAFDSRSDRYEPVERPEGRTSEAAVLLHADQAEPGILWVGGRSGGLDRVADGTAARHDSRTGLGLERAHFMARDRDGRLVAAGDAGLYRLVAGRWQEMRFHGDAITDVRGFHESGDGSAWILSGSHGLSRALGGSIAHYGERQGLPTNELFSLQLDPEGRIWISGNEGILLVRADDFGRWANGTLAYLPTALLGPRDGLRNRECNGWGSPASWALADGRFVYPVSDGVAIVSPGAVPNTRLSPAQIVVDAAWSGERPLDTGRPLVLGTAERALRLRFSTLEFFTPEAVSFRYRLDNADRAWVSAAGEAEASYAYLAPGRYAFHVQARLPGQEWTDAERVLPVAVLPTFTESTAFRALLAGSAATGLAWLFAWRLRTERRHARAIHGERALLRAVIDTSPNPIYLQDRDRKVLLANRATETLQGPAAAAGGPDAQAPPAGIPALDALHTEVVATRSERALQEWGHDQDGALRWFRVVERPIVDRDGAVVQVVGTAVDVTAYRDAVSDLQRRELELEASRVEALQLARRLMHAHEEERRRLGRELHDDVTQRLAGLAMLARSAARAATVLEVERLRHACEEIGIELQRLVSDTQDMSRDLHPALLERVGLVAALESECASFGTRAGLPIRFSAHAVPPVLAPEVGLALYRIVQEALRNCASHARARVVDVVLEGSSTGLLLEVRDDGVGFDPASVGAHAGLGLASIAERARLVRAELDIVSGAGPGTTIRVFVPLGTQPETLA